MLTEILTNGMAVAIGAKSVTDAFKDVNIARYEKTFAKAFKKDVDTNLEYDPVFALADLIVYTYAKKMKILTFWDVKVIVAKYFPKLRYSPSHFEAVYRGGIKSLLKWRDEDKRNKGEEAAEIIESINKVYRSDSKEQDRLWNEMAEGLLDKSYKNGDTEFVLNENFGSTPFSIMQILHNRFGYEYEEIGSVLKQLEYEENYSYQHHEGKYASEWKKKRKAAEPDLI